MRLCYVSGVQHAPGLICSWPVISAKLGGGDAGGDTGGDGDSDPDGDGEREPNTGPNHQMDHH